MEVSRRLHTPATLPLGKGPKYPSDSRSGGLLTQYGRCGEEKNILPLSGIEHQPSSTQPVAILTELSRLLHGVRTRFIGVSYEHSNAL
jgi:hypothetical protein